MIVANDLKWSEYVDRMVGMANRMLCMLKGMFESRNPKLWRELYASLVKPHLEYAVKAWNPHLQRELEKPRESKEGLPESHLILRNKCMRKD